MFDLIGKRYRGSPGKLSFLSPDVATFPTEEFLRSSSSEALTTYARALDDDIAVLKGKLAALHEEYGQRHPVLELEGS
jgi:hypothetical protein